MATYEFLTIASEEANRYAAGRDELRFTGLAEPTAQNFAVEIFGGGGMFALRYKPTGSSVTFGPYSGGASVRLPDGSILVFPSLEFYDRSGGAGADNLYGGAGPDTLSGLDGGDRVDGGDGPDWLSGGPGADTLTGGAAIDFFIWSAWESGTAEGGIDVVADWEASDRIRLPLTGGGAGYAEFAAANYASALTTANQQIASGAADVVAVAVGGDVVVFADTRNDNGQADDAFLLRGRNLDWVDAFNFFGLSAGPAPQPPPPLIHPVPTAGTLQFSFITEGEALGYDATANDLSLQANASDPEALKVSFNADGTVTFTAARAGQERTLLFGAGIQGETGFIFADGARMALGTSGADIFLGSRTEDFLFGGPGADTLNGGGKPDQLFGGSGADLFVVAPAESSGVAYDVIRDWETGDRLTFGGPVATASNYVELTGSLSLSDAQAQARAQIAAGSASYVAAQVGDSVFVFTGQTALVQLRGGVLGAIDHNSIVAIPRLAFPALSPLPDTATSALAGPITYVGGAPQVGASIRIEGNVDTARIGSLFPPDDIAFDATSFSSSNNLAGFQATGSGFTYLEVGDMVYVTGGMATSLTLRVPGFLASYSGPAISLPQLVGWAEDNATGEALSALLSGSDSVTGRSGADLIRGFTGDDTLGGGGGADTVWGGIGDDVIYAGSPQTLAFGAGVTYLRGEEGDDWILGGAEFDDIHGNMGADSAGGAAGNDWVVGGKDNDLLYGDAGDDIVYGNMGADTCEGGDGNDVVRGGQDNDVVRGGAGADYVSGDKGDDTVTGGTGADLFHTFGDAGIDRVTDFKVTEGDRVLLDPGTQYAVAQVGADTVISMTGGGQMVLVGVSLSTLSGSWILGA
ncbi:calcium-binding protein [Phenylobacterium sp.]|uniref:calcium-binding protein n=1 Tax=Phenylobacterium sp. TaxID=1871053 RepID=UPI0035B25C73